MVVLSCIFLLGFLMLGNKCDTDMGVEKAGIIRGDIEEEVTPTGEEEKGNLLE